MVQPLQVCSHAISDDRMDAVGAVLGAILNNETDQSGLIMRRGRVNSFAIMRKQEDNWEAAFGRGLTVD